ncbi:MAG: cytidylate kinase-like family protein [Bacteriovoracaceae bacterium]|nr:cytidylate kinase-like family protein [Bacteriovoracaceae bacterium]
MSNELYLPSADKRLSKWLEIQDRVAAKDNTERKTITISRKYGCQGYPVANRLKDILDKETGEEWTIFDRELLDLISAKEHISRKLLEESANQEATHNFLSSFFPQSMEQEDYYHLIAKYIFEISRKGNAIIVGRGAEFLTQDLKNCYRFRIDASQEFRIENMAQTENIDLNEAEKLVKENENTKEEFIQKHFSRKVGMLDDYHAIYNNKHSDVELIAKSIAHCIE